MKFFVRLFRFFDDEARGRAMDVWCKIVTTVFIVIGGTLTIVSYLTTRADVQRTAGIEARKPIFEKQLEVCISAVSLANAASVNPSSKEAREAAKAYEALYRSALMVIADNDMFIPASHFSDCLANSACLPDLGVRADELANGCNKSLNYSWATRLHTPARPQMISIQVK